MTTFQLGLQQPPMPACARIPLVALLAVALLAFLGVASAQADVPAGQVRGYVEDFDVPSSEAEERLVVQDRGAENGIVEVLRNSLGERFAGVWFDNDAGEFVVPLVDGSGPIRSALSEVHLKNDFKVLPARFTWDELEEIHRRVDDALAPLIRSGLIQTSLDPRANAVVVDQVLDIDDAAQGELRSLLKGENGAVQVRSHDVERFGYEQVACKAQWAICDIPLRAGVGIGEAFWSTCCSPRCTAGFKAIGNTFGNRFVLTAGHCGNDVRPINHWNSWDLNFVNQDIGYVEQRVTAPYGDYLKINANGSYWDVPSWPTRVAYWGVNQDLPITAESSSFMGEYVCHVGAASGATEKSCGTVTALDKTVTQPVVGIMYHNTEFQETCAKGGDSGGPVFTGNTALGIMVADNTGVNGEQPAYCHQKGYYMEITEAADALGVTVAPRVGAPPYAQTGAPTNVQGTQATVSGTVDPNGVPTNFYVEYGPTLGYGSATQVWSAGSGWGPGPVSGVVSGLEPVTTYHYRIIAASVYGSSVGGDQVFTTTATAPLVATTGVSGVAAGGATLNGTVNPRGAATKYHFEYGTTTSYGTSVPVPDAEVPGTGISNVAVTQAIKGIKGLTTYHYRLVAENSKGKTVSADSSFTTPDWRPAVSVEAQTDVKVQAEAGRASVHGSVNPRGFATHYRFEWGTDAEFKEGKYTHLIPVPDANLGSGESGVNVEQAMVPLKGQTTYHFRLVAENAEGKTVSADKSFTTPDWRPGLSFQRVIGVGRDKATLTETVNPKGFKTTYRFEYGTSEAYGTKVPVPDKEIAAGTEGVELSQPLGGLLPNTTYHYRLVATNAEGTSISLDEAFTPSTTGFVPDAPNLLGTAIYTHQLSGNFPAVNCTGGGFTAVMSSPAETLLPASMGNATCSVFGVNETLNMNGCKFELDPGYSEDGISFGGEMNIGPPGCGPIRLEGTTCKLSISPQVGFPANFSNTEGEKASITAEVHASYMKYTPEGGIICPASGLTRTGNYYGAWQIKAYANEAHTAQGNVRLTPSFKVAPKATLTAASGVSFTKATLNGTVNPNLLAASYQFEYGPTDSYGAKAPAAAKEVGAGGKDVEAAQAIEGLKAGFTYHYRLAASNSAGAAYSQDATFTTPKRHVPLLEAEKYPATIAGEQGAVGSKEIKFVTEPGWNVKCTSGLFAGSASAPAAAQSLEANFSGCTAMGQQATVAMNSCSYVLRAANSGPPYSGTVDLACSKEGDGIKVSVGSPTVACTITIPAQTIATAAYENTGTGNGRRITATLSGSGISYTSAGGGGCGPSGKGTLSGTIVMLAMPA